MVRLQRHAGNRAVTVALDSTAHAQRNSLAALPNRESMRPGMTRASRAPIAIQRDLAQSLPTAHGVFGIDMKAQNGAATGTGASGLTGSVEFEPSPKSPYTSKLGLVQIVKLTTAKGDNVNPASMPAAAAPHLRTKQDAKAGVEKGFFTDVLHQNFGTTPPTVSPKGQAHGSYYEGGTPVFGFRRSVKAADIKAAKLTDRPGTTGKSDLDFTFETVAKGDDNLLTYGAIHWAFKLRGGKVEDETASVSDDASATYDDAVERHEDFYVLEPVTVYFDFNADTPSSGENAKFARIVRYLTRFPDVRVRTEGFTDLRGSAAYNRALAARRGQSCVDALVALGIDAGRFDAPVARGITSSFTADAVTAQDEEANRRGNRRVMLTFSHTASTP